MSLYENALDGDFYLEVTEPGATGKPVALWKRVDGAWVDQKLSPDELLMLWAYGALCSGGNL